MPDIKLTYTDKINKAIGSDLHFVDKKRREWVFSDSAFLRVKTDINRLKANKKVLDKEFLTLQFPDDLRRNTKKAEKLKKILPKRLVNLVNVRRDKTFLFRTSRRLKTDKKMVGSIKKSMKIGALDEDLNRLSDTTFAEASAINEYINYIFDNSIRDAIKVNGKTIRIIEYTLTQDIIRADFKSFSKVVEQNEKFVQDKKLRENLTRFLEKIQFKIAKISVSETLEPPRIIGDIFDLKTQLRLHKAFGSILLQASNIIQPRSYNPNLIIIFVNDVRSYLEKSVLLRGKLGRATPNLRRIERVMVQRTEFLITEEKKFTAELKKRRFPTPEEQRALSRVPLPPKLTR